jgi:AraC family transcriptional activator of pobA
MYISNMEPIATYNLFGESAELPDVVHCETIEARSVIHDWEFRPHRHGRLHQFLVIEAGGGRTALDGHSHPLRAGLVLNVPAGCVHGFSFTPGTRGWVVTLATEVLEAGLVDGEGLRPQLAHPAIAGITDAIRSLVQAIFAEFDARRFARAHVLRAQSALLAGLVAREVSHRPAGAAVETKPLQRRFEALVEAHFREHLSVRDYAHRLAVTPTHLSRVMRAATGRPASAAIEERLLREARRNLAYSHLSISEIAYQLGYQDPAYFSRVFSRGTGFSPRAFRTRLDRHPA